MSYGRDDATETERNTLAARLAETRQALAAQASLRERERQLENDLANVDASRAGGRGAAVLPSGAKISIASPCTEDWSRMTGDDYVRHCSKCDKKVYDLSGLKGIEIEALLARQGEPPCVRFFKRKDGTMMTADCPVGRPKRVALRVLTAIGLSGLAGLAAHRAYEVYEASQPCALMGAPTSNILEPTAMMGAMPAPQFEPETAPLITQPAPAQPVSRSTETH